MSGANASPIGRSDQKDERSECKPDRAQLSKNERSECKPDAKRKRASVVSHFMFDTDLG